LAKGEVTSVDANVICKGNLVYLYLLSYSLGGSTRRDFDLAGAFGTPILGQGRSMVAFGRVIVVSYRLFIVTTVLSQTYHSATISHPMSSALK